MNAFSKAICLMAAIATVDITPGFGQTPVYKTTEEQLASGQVFPEAITLEQCQKDAEQNIPLIRRYELVHRAANYKIENIKRGWLPQITATAQATVQNRVTEWPDAMKSLLERQGVEVAGLKKDQYKIGIDIAQTLYDGGNSRNQKELTRAEAEAQTAQTTVDIYAVRKQVNELYFGILLIDEKIKLNNELTQMLMSNEQKLSALRNGGLASDNDVRNIKAERINARQQLTQLKSQRAAFAKMLAQFCGKETADFDEVGNIAMPETPAIDIEANRRPELSFFDNRLAAIDAQQGLLDSKLRPRLTLFATAYYGYPGFNMFEDIMQHDWSLNALIGAKLTWNIGALYTRKNDKAQLEVQRLTTENQREVFLFNNKLETTQTNEAMDRYKNLIDDDEEIVTLRTEIRQTSEAKLDHGIIDTTTLLGEIFNENSAKLQLSTHKIEQLKEAYNMKYSTNQ